MSYVLPKETQTQKISTLPDDLKNIAEELIRNKFKVKEKKARSVHDEWGPFPGFAQDFPPQSAWTTGTYAGSAGSSSTVASHSHGFSERQRGYQDYIRVEHQPWSNRRFAELRIRRPSYSNLMQALKRLDMENIRGSRTLVMSYGFFDELSAQEDTRMYLSFADRRPREGEKNVIANIFGCDVVVHPGVADCILEAEF